jgi:hypothetical protein
VIELKDPTNALSTQRDIIANPKNLKFRELDSAMLLRVLDQVDLALINTNYALDAGLNPTKDALAIESKDSPYVNFLVARPDNKDDARVQKLAKALTSPQVKASSRPSTRARCCRRSDRRYGVPGRCAGRWPAICKRRRAWGRPAAGTTSIDVEGEGGATPAAPAYSFSRRPPPSVARKRRSRPHCAAICSRLVQNPTARPAR